MQLHPLLILTNDHQNPSQADPPVVALNALGSPSMDDPVSQSNAGILNQSMPGLLNQPDSHLTLKSQLTNINSESSGSSHEYSVRDPYPTTNEDTQTYPVTDEVRDSHLQLSQTTVESVSRKSTHENNTFTFLINKRERSDVTVEANVPDVSKTTSKVMSDHTNLPYSSGRDIFTPTDSLEIKPPSTGLRSFDGSTLQSPNARYVTSKQVSKIFMSALRDSENSSGLVLVNR